MLSELPLEAVRDRGLLLRSLGVFSALDDEALATLAEHARLRRFRDGEVIANEGDPATHIHVMVSGCIVSHRQGKLVARARRGGVGGVLSLLADEASTSLVAEGDTVTMEIGSGAFLAALMDNFSMMRNSLCNLAAGLVSKRGDLPASPTSAPKPEMGHWYEQPRTLVETVMRLRARGGPMARGNLEAVFALGGAAHEIRPGPNEILWRIGEPSSYLLRVEYGIVRCSAADGRSVDVGSGFVLGVLDALGRVDRSYEARTQTKVIAYRTSIDAYLAVLENYVDLGRALVANLARAHLDTPED